jgi:anaerobic selenocysteine-containing dehydrogenase
MGLIDSAQPIVLQLYVEPLQRFRLAAEGHGSVVPPAEHRDRIATYFDPLPFWYMPFEEARVDREAFPLHALTQRPMQMYHSWHSQNAWLRQILGYNRLYINRMTGRALGLDEEDWAWVTSHQGRIRVPTRLMDGVNPDTVWTWNAIGKRAGAWNLDPNAPEFRKGFLLNHLISELLPDDGGYSYSNADPITGQAAWYDLRVRIERAAPAEAGASAPSFPAVAHPPSLRPPPSILRYGADSGRQGAES